MCYDSLQLTLSNSHLLLTRKKHLKSCDLLLVTVHHELPGVPCWAGFLDFVQAFLDGIAIFILSDEGTNNKETYIGRNAQLKKRNIIQGKPVCRIHQSHCISILGHQVFLESRLIHTQEGFTRIAEKKQKKQTYSLIIVIICKP